MPTTRTYRFGESQLTIEFGDITTSTAQAIVSSDDVYLTMGGGVSAAIRLAGGDAIALDAAKKVPAALGDVIVTTAGSLPAQYVFHAITIDQRMPSSSAGAAGIVEQATQRCMELLDTLELGSIAFPAIGSGAARFDLATVAAKMANVIAKTLIERTRPVDVSLYLMGRHATQQIDYIAFFEEFAKQVPDVAGRETDSRSRSVEVDARPPDADKTVEELKSLRILALRKLLLALQQQQSELDIRLVGLLNGDDDAAVEAIQRKLGENQTVRLSYMGELTALREGDVHAAAPPKDEPKTVFVSSTYRDLLEYRTAVREQIAKRDLFFRGMEFFGADPYAAPAAKIVDEVRKADVYLGIFGVRYGSIDEATGLSMTELEYNSAETQGMPMLLYVIKDDAQVRAGDIEPDPKGKGKLDAFKERVLRNPRATAYMFGSVPDLANQVYIDLGKLLSTQAS